MTSDPDVRPAHTTRVPHPVAWLRSHDAGLLAFRRATRTAVVMPAIFAFGVHVVGDATVATFAAFGSFAMLLLPEFSGTLRDRLRAELMLGVAGAVLVAIATLVCAHAWLAAALTAPVVFVVLFSGVTSSVIASASTSLLLVFIVSVATPAPISAVPLRLAGWGLAVAAALVATAVLWPAPARHPLRVPAVQACRRLAERLRAEGYYRRGDPGWTRGQVDDAVARARETVAGLQRSFYAAQHRPTGLSTSARIVVRLVDEIGWLGRILDAGVEATEERPPGTADPAVCAVHMAAADVMDRGAELLEKPADRSRDIEEATGRLSAAITAMELRATHALPVHRRPAGPDAAEMEEFVSSLEPSFRAQEISYAVTIVAANIALTAAAERRSWWAQLLGRQPAGVDGSLATARHRAAGHLRPHSVWLHNSLRGAVALTLAVLVSDLSGVQHSFWVVLGTLSVLRSNALSTGQNVLRGLAGTTAGVLIGGVIVWVIGTQTAVLWALLPIAVVMAGVAPAAISFAAGQAAFTVTLLILFNIVAPVGWKVGLVRVEDVAIGCAVSLFVGVLFWPRGAAQQLAVAMADSYVSAASYLRSAVDFGLHSCDATAAAVAGPAAASAAAAAAARRLDDAFRSFLGERGPKQLSLADVTSLVTGVAGLRLAADAVVDLWSSPADAADGDRSAARREVVAHSAAVAQWYDALAAALRGNADVPPPLPADKDADQRLIGAVRRDLADTRGHGTATGVRIIWTADHIDAARRLQSEVAASAGVLPRPRHARPGTAANLGRPVRFRSLR
ncbi:MAG: hypothetical protein QOI42_257, partial [Frankiaceae bacterium]|nr:hypothetical protein [Frankiaceae bacterium]